ncbi:MAG: aminotransferase class I/II-fold pyridoxal phosphate-dependent enzyme, partial [Armatimonadota bacterium]|nr:aminotransferase class I/II-fold pyridoxal phosphate-dependent enzyme [Armatimonadota bacterium]
ATLPGMRSRTITISGASKTYAVTGWRVGWCVAPPNLTNAIRKVHDFLTVGAPAPLQEAVAVALGFDQAYYDELASSYRQRREVLVDHLQRVGFGCSLPRGAYYVMTDISNLGFDNDVTCALWLVEHARVAAVPGSSFYHRREDGARQVRFAFPKQLPTLHEAGRRLAAALRGRVGEGSGNDREDGATTRPPL